MSYELKDISVVIPSYNNLEYLKLVYKSIRTQSKEVEVILFSDGSDDGTTAWLKSLIDENFNIIVYDKKNMYYNLGEILNIPSIWVRSWSRNPHSDYSRLYLKNIKNFPGLGKFRGGSNIFRYNKIFSIN